jgi:hypothetical protein
MRVVDVGDPSALNTTPKKHKKYIKNKSDKDKLIGKLTVLTKEPNHILWSPASVESDSSSPEHPDLETVSIWEIIKPLR